MRPLLTANTCAQDGLRITGVTVLYTVKAMDAGPILAQQKLPVDPDIQAPEVSRPSGRLRGGCTSLQHVPVLLVQGSEGARGLVSPPKCVRLLHFTPASRRLVRFCLQRSRASRALN